MRTLKYAILGLLSQQNMTGYELTQKFENLLNEFWSAKHSQIYPELKKLTAEGMVEYTVAISGQVLEKKVYSITDLGRKDFIQWLNTEEPLGETAKDVFRLRIFFSSFMEPQTRERQLKSQLLQHEIRLEHLKQNRQKQFHNSIPQKDTADFADYLVLMGGIMREEMMCEWIKKCQELIS